MSDAVDFEQLNIQITRLLEEQTQRLSEASDLFYLKKTRNSEDYIALLQSVLEATDTILSEVQPYTEKPFFLPTLKAIQQLKSEATSLMAHFVVEEKQRNTQKFTRRLLREDEQRVYVALFQNDGANLAKWAVQLASLGSYIAGRPVYQSEADVLKWVRSKSEQSSEAFVSLIVEKKYIQNSVFYEKRRDFLGSLLLFVDSRQIAAGQIEEFVHRGKRYVFSEGCLLLREGTE